MMTFSSKSVIFSASLLLFGSLFFSTGCQNSRSSASRPELEKARHFIAQGNYAAAFIQLNQALAEAPRDPDVHLNLGWLYLYTDDVSHAEQEWVKAHDLAPNRAEGYHLKGALLTEKARPLENKNQKAYQQRQEEAILNFREALRRDNKNSQTYFDLATSLLSLNRNQEALDALDQGFDHIPEKELDTQVDFQIASCSAHARLGMYEEAIADCRQAREFTSNPAQKQRVDDMVESMKLLNPSAAAQATSLSPSDADAVDNAAANDAASD
jgi:tetratricopeptide (TPR) repeat protein